MDWIVKLTHYINIMKVFGIEREYIIHDENQIKGFFDEYRYLSNFEVAEVVFEGVKYPSTENAYQAAKSIDPEVRKKFVNITPSESKKLGRQIQIREDWEQVKYRVMYEIVFDKFTRHSKLGDLLLETGDRYLEETNHWSDKIWGVCDGVGTNWLGKILMDVRNQIRSSGKSWMKILLNSAYGSYKFSHIEQPINEKRSDKLNRILNESK